MCSATSRPGPPTRTRPTALPIRIAEGVAELQETGVSYVLLILETDVPNSGDFAPT